MFGSPTIPITSQRESFPYLPNPSLIARGKIEFGYR